MIEILKIKARKRPSSLLGLSLDGSRLEGVVLRRNNGSIHVQQSFGVALSLDPLTAATELVGREIRNHLDAAGIRERNCVFGLPLKWVLTTHAEVPEMQESDIPGFLQIEAERGFPCDVTTLHFAESLSRPKSGNPQALLVGVPKNHLTLMEAALRAAKLRPLSFSLGIVALQPPDTKSAESVMALAIGESTVGLQVNSGGGVATLRALEGALDQEGGRRVLHAGVIAREARITLGQLPGEMRESIRRIRIFGARDLAQQLADELELRLESMGLKVELVSRYAPSELGVQLPSETPVSPALSLAAVPLSGKETPFELLPPK